MNIFTYIEALKLDKSKILALRNRDYIQLEKKLISKSYLSKEIDKKEIPKFIQVLRYSNREISSFLDPAFFVLRKIVDNPKEHSLYVPKKSIKGFETDKMRQFIKSQYGNELNTYVELNLAGNYLRPMYTLMHYWNVLPDDCKNKITEYLTIHLEQLVGFVQKDSQFSTDVQEMATNPFFFRALNAIHTPEIDHNIVIIQGIILTKLANQDNAFENVQLAFALSFYEIENEEITRNLAYLRQRAEEKGMFESVRSDKNPKGGVSKKMEYPKGNKNSRSYSGAAAGAGLAGIGVVIAIIRGIISFSSINDTPPVNNSYYKEQKKLYRAPDYEIREQQKKLVYVHTTKEITNTQKEEFNYDRMKFISEFDKYPFPGPHTTVKNESDKRVVFFYNNDFGGFKYKLIEPKSEAKVIFRYTYFLVLRGNDPYYTVYTDENGESKVGILFNEFDDNDLRLLKTLHINEYQKVRKESEIIISDLWVSINAVKSSE
ncbi:MAG: hypothetical protein ABF242_03405 [Flavobacteriales bacterium]